MADTLFLRKSTDTFEWLRFNGQGQLLSQGNSPLEEIDNAEFAVYVVPGSDILSTSAVVPSRQYRQILQTVPFVVEEKLAVDVEDCFFALGNRDDQGEVLVAVADLALMRQWSSEIEMFPFNVIAVIAEHSLINAEKANAALLDQGQLHFHLQKEGPVSLPESELSLAAASLEEGESISLWSDGPLPVSVEIQVRELEAAGITVECSETLETPFERLCRGYSGSEINLLQGEFKRQEKSSPSHNIWRSVATLALVGVCLHLLSMISQGWYLHSKAADFEAETFAIYKATFPSDRNVRDVRRRWNSHLGKKKDTKGEFISLLSRSTRQLEQSRLTVTNINFNESRGDLVLQVLGKQSEDLVEYSQTLTVKGLDAEIGTITQDDGAVRGSVRVRDSS